MFASGLLFLGLGALVFLFIDCNVGVGTMVFGQSLLLGSIAYSLLRLKG